MLGSLKVFFDAVRSGGSGEASKVDGSEDAVAALRAQLADAQRGGFGIHRGERISEVGAAGIRLSRLDHEGESRGHAMKPTRREYPVR